MPTSNPLDEMYIVGEVQDPNEPIWESDAAIEAMTFVDDPTRDPSEQDSLRRSDGMLEFIQDIVEEIDNFLEVDESRAKPKGNRLDPIRTRPVGTDKWRAGSRTVTENMGRPIAVASPNRRRITLVNHGPNEVYLSASSSSGQTGTGGVFMLPAVTATLFPQITIETKDDVWALCAAGETANVNLIEEFDLES